MNDNFINILKGLNNNEKIKAIQIIMAKYKEQSAIDNKFYNNKEKIKSIENKLFDLINTTDPFLEALIRIESSSPYSIFAYIMKENYSDIMIYHNGYLLSDNISREKCEIPNDLLKIYQIFVDHFIENIMFLSSKKFDAGTGNNILDAEILGFRFNIIHKTLTISGCPVIVIRKQTISKSIHMTEEYVSSIGASANQISCIQKYAEHGNFIIFGEVGSGKAIHESQKVKVLREKPKIFCKNCEKELLFNNKTGKYEAQCDCNTFYMTKRFCNKCNKLTNHRGLGNVCVACQMKDHNSSDLMRKSTIKNNIKYNKSEKMFKRFKESHEIKFCKICNKETLHLAGKRCINCFNKSEDKIKASKEMMNIRLTTKQNCKICGYYGLVDSFFYGKECGCHDKFYQEHNIKISQIAKNNLYSELSNKINLLDLDKNIINLKIEDIENQYLNIPGVWSIWGKNKQTNEIKCLTVGQSKDIGKEIKRTLRILSNKDLQNLEIDSPNCTGRWCYIQNAYENFYYTIISKNNNSFESREEIEALYAIKNKSEYWKPSPTQSSYSFLEKLKKED